MVRVANVVIMPHACAVKMANALIIVLQRVKSAAKATVTIRKQILQNAVSEE